MPTYAVLGATGNTGQALLQILLQSPNKKVHAYCRSAQKLYHQNPHLLHNKNLTVFEGPLENPSLIATCIRSTHAVFLAVAVPDNMPGVTIAQTTARITIQACRSLRIEDPTSPLPKLIVLSSAKLDDTLNCDLPAFAKRLIHLATSHQTLDLQTSRTLLLAESHWLDVTFMMPGGLTHDTQKGHELSTTREKSPLSFLDLAAGMLEVADEEEGAKWRGRNVCVLPTGRDVRFPWGSLAEVVKGVLAHFWPWTYAYTGAMVWTGEGGGK